MKRSKKHTKIVTDYDRIKSKHLDRLASKTLDKDETSQQLKKRPVKFKFLFFFIICNQFI